jgi:hypothetical protein
MTYSVKIPCRLTISASDFLFDERSGTPFVYFGALSGDSLTTTHKQDEFKIGREKDQESIGSGGH